MSRFSNNTLTEMKDIITEGMCKAWGEYKAGHTNWCGSMERLKEEFRIDVLSSDAYYYETIGVRAWVAEVIERLPVV